MKAKPFRGLASALSLSAITWFASPSGEAAVSTKVDNTVSLDLAGSWTPAVPGAADVATWSGTYNTAGSLSAALPAGAITWQGIRTGAVAGTAAGLISIGGAGVAVTGSQLTVGTSGIDMTGATQDLVLNAATLAFDGAQTWKVPAGRNLRLAGAGTGAMNANVDGAGGDATVITVTGGGVVDANQGATNGFADFTGKWVVDAGTTLRGLQNGTTAWGTNTTADAILLQGGTLAVGGISGGTQANWSWTTPVTLAAGSTSTLNGQYPDTNTRQLVLQGSWSGEGNLVVSKSAGGTLRVVFDTPDGTRTGATSIQGIGAGVTANNLTVQASVAGAAGVKTPLGSGDITVSNGATLEFTAPSASNTSTSILNNITLNAATLRFYEGIQSVDGTLTISGANTLQGSVDGKHATINGLIGDGATAGSLTIRSTGAQRMIFPQPNSFTGGTILGTGTSNSGLVVLGDASALGTGPITVRGAQIISEVAGLTLTNTLVVGGGTGGGLCVGGAESITFTSKAVVDNASRPFQNSGTGLLTLAGGIDLTSGTGAVASFGSTTAKGPVQVTGPITGTGKVEVKGGTVTLSGANTYTGSTAVSSVGKLILTGSLTSNITLTGASASIQGNGSTTGSFTTSGTSASAATILLDPAKPTEAISANAVNFSGVTKVDLLNQQALGTTTYTVVKYGTLAGLNNLVVANQRAVFADDAANKRVTLAVTSANRTWSAAAGTTWNLTDLNWAEGDQRYFNGDAVTFGDTAAGAVGVSGVVLPYSVTFANSLGNDYVFTSSAGNCIGGTAGIIKTGTGTALLVGENKHTGSNRITGGVLAIRQENALGAAPSAPMADHVVLDGGTLKFAPAAPAAFTTSANRGIRLDAAGGALDTTAVSSSFTATVTGEISGNGPLVLLANGDTSDTGGGFPGATLLDAFNTFTGPITIRSGVVAMNSSFGETTNPVILDGGGLVDRNTNVFFGNDILIGAAGGVLRTYGSASTTFYGALANAPGVTKATVRHTDGGTQFFQGDGSGFNGTFINSRGTVYFDSENWSGMDLVNFDGGQARFASGTLSKVRSITTDNDLHIEVGTILDVTSGKFTVAPGTATSNFWVQNAGSITSSSGTLEFDFQTPYTTTGATDQAVRVLIEDYDAATPLRLVKTGPGDMANVDQPNTYTGGTLIRDGRLTATNGSALGFGAVTVEAGGQAYLAMANATYGNAVVLDGTGPGLDGNIGALRMNNNSLAGDVTIGAGGARIGALTGATGTLLGVLGGPGVLEINSPAPGHAGTIHLAGLNETSTSTVHVSQGRLDVSDRFGGTILVRDGASIGGEGLVLGSVQLGESSGAGIFVPVATPVGLFAENLTINGNVTVSLDGVPLPEEKITVVEFKNLLSGGASNFRLSATTPYRGSFANTGTAIELSVVTGQRTWTGASSSSWDSGTPNWAEDDKKFFTGDQVVFGNGPLNRTITISSPVSPASVLFENSSGNDYTITGRIQVPATGSLVKRGTGTTTLAGAASNFAGEVRIEGGTFVLGTVDYQRGFGAAPEVVVENGTLRLNGTNVLYDGAGSSAVTVNAGGVVDLNAYHNHFKVLNLNGGTIIGTRAEGNRYNNEYSTFDISVNVGGNSMSTITRKAGDTGVYAIAGAPFEVGDTPDVIDLLVSAPFVSGALTKSGPGTMALTAASAYAGGTLVNAGTLLANNSTGSASGGGAVIVKSGATLGGTGIASGSVTLESGAALSPGSPSTAIESLGTGALTLGAGSSLRTQIQSSGTPAADQVNVAGDVTLGGSLNLEDVAATPAVVPGGTKLTVLTYTGTLTGTFAGRPEGQTLTLGINSFKIRYNDAKKVTLESLAAVTESAYQTWAKAQGFTGGPAADDDRDGVGNALEWVLGGSSATRDGGRLPVASIDGSNVFFTFKRDRRSLAAGASLAIQAGTGLDAWSASYPVGATGIAPVTISDNGDGTDTVRLTLPRGQDSRKFARLRVTLE